MEDIPARNVIAAHMQGFMDKWQIAIKHSEGIHTVHLLSTQYSRCLMFAVYM
jgi:hypothetical protein